MKDKILKVSDANFEEEVLKASLPVLVDFWAEWCAPCQMIAPALEHIAQEYEGKIRVVKLNVDENAKTPPHYGIKGIPSLLLFKEGELRETMVGVHPKEKIIAAIKKHI